MNEAKKIAKQIVECFKRGNSVYIFGNGGSLQDAGHFSAEFNGIGPVIALNDPAKITSIGNDFGFENIFTVQVKDLSKPGDIIIGLSSSGKSRNVVKALKAPFLLNLETIDFPRKGKTTQEVQNYQYRLLHSIYVIIKKELS